MCHCNDGSIGNTFEYHLNVKENNLTEADFDDFEVKAKNEATSSVRSLFSKKPTFPPKGDGYMLSQWGYPEFQDLGEFPLLENL
jgi:hypothetical protein